jgi:hypothetical protein
MRDERMRRRTDAEEADELEEPAGHPAAQRDVPVVLLVQVRQEPAPVGVVREPERPERLEAEEEERARADGRGDVLVHVRGRVGVEEARGLLRPEREEGEVSA